MHFYKPTFLSTAIALASVVALGMLDAHPARADLEILITPLSQGLQANTSFVQTVSLTEASTIRGYRGSDKTGFASVERVFPAEQLSTNQRWFLFIVGPNGSGNISQSGTSATPVPANVVAPGPYSPITLQILGTAGETGLVNLNLLANYSFVTGTPGSSGMARVSLNGTTVLDSAFTSSNTSTGSANFLINVGDVVNFSAFTQAKASMNAPLLSPVGTLTTTFTLTPLATSAVPEPSTLALFGTGLLPLVGMVRRQRRG